MGNQAPVATLQKKGESSQTLAGGHFKKHLATVFIRGTLSSLGRKFWNGLTRNAFFELQKKEEHTCPVSVLCESAGFNSNDIKAIRETLKSLTSTPIEWISEGEGGEIQTNEEWGACSFLSQAKIRNGVIHYAYAPFLREQLAHPETYSRINLAAQRNLSRGRCQTLYEITSRYRVNGKFPGKTPVWTLEYFRAMMGTEDPSYNSFKVFNSRILKPNITKVNEGTDIRITPKLHRTGRKYTGIQFMVEDNPQMPLLSEEEIQESPIFKDLVKYGVVPLQAENFIQKHSEEYLRGKIRLIEASIDKIKSSPGGFLRDAIEKDWKLVDPKELKAAQRKKVTAKKLEATRVKSEKQAEEDAAFAAKVEEEKQVFETVMETLDRATQNGLEKEFFQNVIKEGFLETAWKKGGIKNKLVLPQWRKYVIENT